MSELDKLGAEHKRLKTEWEALKPKLHAAMLAERAAGATQNNVRERSGYATLQRVRIILGESSKTRAPAQL